MKYFQILLGIFCLNLNASYEITVLATNISNYGGFGEWSFSALYESEKESILFDTGFHEDTVLHNAKVLNKDLSKVEKVILSHFHSDHTGGLIKLRKTYKPLNKNAFKNVYVPEVSLLKDTQHQEIWWVQANYSDANKFKKDAEGEGITFIILDSHAEIAKDLFATGTVLRTDEYYNGPKGLLVRDGKSNNLVEDIIVDDQSAGMLTNSGWIMMSGCGHSGIINTAKKLQSIHNVPIYGAIGGFHLFQASDDVIDKTALWLKNAGMEKFMGGHCTGIYAAERVADMIGIRRR
jgi:7,8-dihydropterin-6-yl-methyl-4-(beta-D-ribofuranosyl)aminobenzene 5'-phosphate synthase